MTVRRLVVVGGTSAYDHQDALPGVPADLDTVSDVFQALGYTEDHRLQDLGTEAFRRGLSDWAASEQRTDDALVLYYSGHGDHDHNRHYLLCRDSRAQQLGGTALATEDLIRIVGESGIERLLLIVDTCYAGQGGVDAARVVVEELGAALTGTRAADEGRFTAFSVIAAARTREAAEDGAFARALRAAVDDLTLGGHRQRKLYLEQVVDRVNLVLTADGPFQHAAWGTLPSGEGYPFFPNPRYDPDLPAGLDLAEQRAWNSREGRRRREELLSHFDPRGRGTDALGGTGSYFTGRVKALAELTAWLTGTAAHRSVVVTGSGGVGKSALLGRLVLNARSGSTPLTAIHARHKLLEEINAGVADAAGIAPDDPAARDPDQLLETLSRRRSPLHIAVDALDEAGTAAGTDAEPERIAAQLLRPLAQLPCVHLLIGTRARAVPALGPDLHRLDLDDPRWTEPGDIRAYAQRLLLAPDGPGSDSPYEQPTAEPVARAIEDRAAGNYLVARLAARSLALRPRTLDTQAPGWREQLPALITDSPRPVGPAFRWALREQLEDQELRGRALLTALALAEGTGLPAGDVWAAMASVLTGDPVGPRDLGWILRAGGSHVVEDVDAGGRSVYRLYHETFADELRAELTGDRLRQVARALTRGVPRKADGSGPDWAAADPYLREHLPAHAAAGGLLDDLVTDPLFLVTVDPATLRRALPAVRTPRARAVRGSYDRIAPHLAAEADVGARGALLRLTAFEMGDRELADATLERVPEQPWVAEWAYVPSPPYPYRSLERFPTSASPEALVECGGRWVLLVAEQERLSCWDAETCELLGELPEPADTSGWSRPYVAQVATCPGGTGGWALVRCTGGGPLDRLQVWDVTRRSPWGTRVGMSAETAALAAVADTLVAGVLDHEGQVRLVDMRTGHELSHLTPRRPTSGWSHDQRLVMEVRGGEIVVAAVRGGFGEGHREVHRWTVSPRDGWRTVDSKSCLLRGSAVEGVVLHEGRVVVATSGIRREAGKGATDAIVDHGDQVEEWTCLTDSAAFDCDFFLNTGKGLVRMTVGMGGVEAVDATGRRTRLLHADLPGAPRIAGAVTGPGEALLAVGDLTDTAVSLWTVPLDGTEPASGKPRRFFSLLGTTLTRSRLGGRDVLTLADGRGVRSMEPESGRLLSWDVKRPGQVASGAAGLPLVVAGDRSPGSDRLRLMLMGVPRRHLILRDLPPGTLHWMEPLLWQGRPAVLGVFGTHAVVWSLTGRRLCEAVLRAEPQTLACRVVDDRVYLAYYAYEHGLDVVELPGGGTIFHRGADPGADLRAGHTHHRQPGGLALDDWDGDLVIAHLTAGGGIKVHGVLDGSPRWTYGTEPKDHPMRLYLHGMGGRRVAITVDFLGTLRVLDIEGGTEAARVPMGSEIQCVTPLPDQRVAVVTSTGLYTLRFPHLSPGAAEPSCAVSPPPPRDPPATDASDIARAALNARLGTRLARRRPGRR